ncbi:MAG: 3-deoxy-7-phosphoheptulonate synthase [Thermodesulfobacteriota bacterium]|jgi:3-deoxy-7-phosphoheptulonate synthase|nr:3-deoxy-7-phosphoheptulonate synthase [Candidatus Dadabacteria bacterium]
MIVVMKSGASPEQIQKAKTLMVELGYQPHPIEGLLRTVIGAIGDERGKPEDVEALSILEGVEKVIPILPAHKIASREFKPENTKIKVRDVVVGNNKIPVIAGPCSVESEEQLMEIAHSIKESGATMLRGGAYKPRSSPYTFQGMGIEGLKLLAQAREETGLPIVTEILDPHDLDSVVQYADVLQIGARNSQNYALLKEVGKSKKPVLLKRGMSTTIKEFLMCAEYILAEGNEDVMLCERGIRTFETATRNTFDLNAIPVLKEKTHLPVIADPSHGTGYWQYVTPMTLAAIAAGADGVIIEVHNNPEVAVSDGGQSLKPHKFKALMEKASSVAKAIGREL